MVSYRNIRLLGKIFNIFAKRNAVMICLGIMMYKDAPMLVQSRGLPPGCLLGGDGQQKRH